MQRRLLRVRLVHLQIDVGFETKKELNQGDGILFDGDVKGIVEHAHVLCHAGMHLAHLLLVLVGRRQRMEVVIRPVRLVRLVGVEARVKEVFHQTMMTQIRRQTQGIQAPRSTGEPRR